MIHNFTNFCSDRFKIFWILFSHLEQMFEFLNHCQEQLFFSKSLKNITTYEKLSQINHFWNYNFSKFCSETCMYQNANVFFYDSIIISIPDPIFKLSNFYKIYSNIQITLDITHKFHIEKMLKIKTLIDFSTFK